jgi:spore germination protein PC
LQNEFYSYTVQMQKYLAVQDNRIAQLESALQALMNEMNEMKNKPAVNVERIEYKFDQLKVETLEGTLNIGLNPNDLRQLDEFTVNGASPGAPYLFPERDAMIQDISHNIYSEMDEMIAESEANTGIPVDPSYREFIKSDVARQLQQRIEMYLNNTTHAERSADKHDHLKEKVGEKIKSDIRLAIDNFIAYSNKQTGGHEKNGV